MDNFINSINDLVQDSLVGSLLAAVIIIAITAVVSYLITRIIRRLTQVDGSPIPESSILVNIARSIVWVVGISIMLSACFKVDVNGLVAALGVSGIALSLGLQDTIKNFFGGLQVTIMGIVKPGDHIVVGGLEGIVQDVSWRQTTVKDYENAVHLIPNAVINATTVTRIKPDYLVVSTVVLNNDGRDIDAMLREMEALAKEAVLAVAPLEKDPWLLVTQIGEYGIWAKMRFVLEDVEFAREARDAALRAIAPYTRNDSSDMMSDD